MNRPRLNPEQAAQLRADVALRASLSNKQLARKYGISLSTVTWYALGKHKRSLTRHHHENGDGV